MSCCACTPGGTQCNQFTRVKPDQPISCVGIMVRLGGLKSSAPPQCLGDETTCTHEEFNTATLWIKDGFMRALQIKDTHRLQAMMCGGDQ